MVKLRKQPNKTAHIKKMVNDWYLSDFENFELAAKSD